MSRAEKALAEVRAFVEERFPTNAVTAAMGRLEDEVAAMGDTTKGLAEWRSIALTLQDQLKHQAGQREAELVTLLKDILHCSDALLFRPDLHARLLDFGRQLKPLAPRDDFPDDYEV